MRHNKKITNTTANDLHWLIKNKFSFTMLQALTGAIIGMIAIFSYLAPIYNAGYVFLHMGKLLLYGLFIGAVSGIILGLVVTGLAGLQKRK